MMRFRAFVLIGLTSAIAAACRGEGAQADSAVVAARRGPASELDCGVDSGDVQIERGPGVLRVGAAVAAVRQRCRIVRDTTVLDNEGMLARELVISIDDDTVVAEVVADSVWRVRVTSPRFRASDGFGVGTPVSDLAATPGARALVGEGEIYVTVPTSCGVSYRIANADFARVSGAPSAEEAMRLLPDTARVDLVLVIGCPDQPDE